MVIILFLFSKIKLCSFKSLEANSYVHFSMLFIHQHNTDFFSFFVFLIYNDVYFENTQCYKKDCNQKIIAQTHGRAFSFLLNPQKLGQRF